MTNSINNKGNHIKITMCHHALKAESGMKSFVGRKDLVAAVYYTIRKCTRGGWPHHLSMPNLFDTHLTCSRLNSHCALGCSIVICASVHELQVN